jgi:hypothetical protein
VTWGHNSKSFLEIPAVMNDNKNKCITMKYISASNIKSYELKPNGQQYASPLHANEAASLPAALQVIPAQSDVVDMLLLLRQPLACRAQMPHIETHRGA